ncbi:glutamate 5-kinase [Cutibacterium avidum]|uniref:glutamate 5-kinase n=1 Tax=Cutibacterium avidum TaxID=33010 RepID=UPI00039189B3|nr:glutamate 5-kinase [Cutibacterium avidum]ERS37296.1 glutamate 5-kinase [Propionibacterium sp. KPL1838]ERS66212.1 glutamate 5-kinase [Propionibacterium sp. KPL1852]ERF55583.1 gamma-glutamyl kinase [Cutibacterium avidum TM16]MCO6633227.1 glutamate 5-kinase [Cutibacterium avidum]MCO6657559.1 glutamate 5-kinase [Cutibacterium avidum]
MTDQRQVISAATTVVVKVGSSSLTLPGGGIDVRRVDELVDVLSEVVADGKRVVLVSSGAIATGFPAMGMTHRPRTVAGKQAAASVGQGILLAHYTSRFASHGLRVGQVLLTVNDLVRPTSYRNAWSTLDTLLELGVVPIVNENDTVATGEIKFGDNDRLAALVAELVRAQALVLLSDVDALYTAHPDSPDARRLDVVEDIDALEIDTHKAGSGVGTGGMTTKLEAARMATSAGVPVVLASASDARGVLGAAAVGTYFRPMATRRSRRLLWLADAATPQGQIVIDEGAVEALTTRHSSLLAVGVTRVHGDFQAGDPVTILAPDGRLVGRGIAQFSHDEVRVMRGRSSAWLAAEMGPAASREIIHRDAMVLSRRRTTKK